MSALSKRSVITVTSRVHSYDVVIGKGIFGEQLQDPRSAIIIDRRFEPLIKSFGSQNCVFIDAIESNKTLATVEAVIIALQHLGVRRDSTVLAVGGGIVQDIATLASSLYMRGIKWHYAPTTLLAMVDSCIGGKSSINTSGVKNLIGNIYPPEAVFVDSEFISTLCERDVLGGMAEAAKIAFCRGSNEFKTFFQFTKENGSNFDDMLTQILRIKKWFVEIDEFDRAERKLLNFGHTFGHALEVASDHNIGHGLAVASGMRAALLFEGQSRSLSDSEEMLFTYTTELVNDLNKEWNEINIDWKKYADAFNSDKKHSHSEYCVIVPNSTGGVRVRQIPKSQKFLNDLIVAQKDSLTRNAP